MPETSDLLAGVLREHLKFYLALSKQLPDFTGDAITEAHEAIRNMVTAESAPCSAYPPVISAVEAAIDYLKLTGHLDGVAYYEYWHGLLVADSALCKTLPSE